MAVLASTHNLCFEKKYKKISDFFLSENFPVLAVKFSIYLNRRVFITCPRSVMFAQVCLAEHLNKIG